MNETISYYNQNAAEYFDMTVNVSMQTLYDQFETYLKPGDKILDLGCGSGRDSKYFLSKGYEVVSVDGSIEMCHLAAKYLGKEVWNITFNELDYVDEFDAVWACASLLHSDLNKMVDVMIRIRNALKKNGLIYASWKYGQGERVDKQRHYIDYDETAVQELFNIASFEIEKMDYERWSCSWL